MKRRKFLQYAGIAAGAAAFPLNGFAINPTARLPFLRALAEGGVPNGRVLVLIQLIGGNDGLNTFIPLDQYDKLANVRSSILIPENQTLSLSGTIHNALHPAMTEMRDLYNDGYVSVVQNVGYPNQDYSHFRSTDIWMSASDADQFLGTGWIGRYLQTEYPGYPTGYPNPDMPDPLAIQIGALTSLTFMGDPVPMGFAISDPQSFYQFVDDLVEPAPNSPYGDELSYIRLIIQQAEVYYQAVKDAADVGQNLSSLYPAQGENTLADQLKIVAQLISGGLKTPVYLVTIDGFDTHSEQVDDASTPTVGMHANLLRRLSEAIGAFQDDLNLLGVADRVAGMTFSEFGRTIASNASLGTDHGAAAPMFAFGKNVIPGIIGDNPQIPATVFGSQDLPMQHDFRSVYASALQDWFGIVNPESILQHDFPILPIFKAPSTNTHALPTDNTIEANNFPNPFRETTTLQFNLPAAGRVSVLMMDLNGKILRTVVDQEQFPAGESQVRLERGGLPAGAYLYQVRTRHGAVTKRLLIL
jgi:uncharacterized protein (DUF1501 family)